MADGNRQIYGQDSPQSYAPVVSFNLVRGLLYYMLCLRMFVAQVNIMTAFLNGKLDENV